jgi:hypothetical protein
VSTQVLSIELKYGYIYPAQDKQLSLDGPLPNKVNNKLNNY